ncbi:radical SAM protein [bacterium]|nr:radical SAM protein [bacterium]
MKVVVANSVGVDEEGYYIVHSPSRWSFSAKNFKEQFTYYPWELAYTSSLLKRETEHQVKFLDGCLNKWDHTAYLARLEEERPDWLIMESSSRTFDCDFRLALAVQEKFGTRLIFCGQHPTAYPEEVIKAYSGEPDKLFICLGEYEYTVLDIISGKNPAGILGLYPNFRRPLLDINSLPWPEDEDTSRIKYYDPPSEYREIQMYASRGCPLKCTFCVCSNLYYTKPNWRPRNVADIVSEIKYLRNKYEEMEGVFFDEEVHNVKKSFILDLTRAIKEEGLDDLHYDAMCAYSTLDEEMMAAMKEAGYYKLRVGIETASAKVAKSIGLGKKFDIPKLLNVLKLAKEIGLKVYGTFTIGAPGSDRHEDEKTTRLIKEIAEEGLLNDLQVSMCTPQPGTPFFKWAEANGCLVTKNWKKYDGAQMSVVSYPDYSDKEIYEVYQQTLSAYDLGREEKRREAFLKTGQSQWPGLGLKKAKKILVMRSTRMWHVNLSLSALSCYFKNVRLDVLAQPIVKEKLRENPQVNKIYLYQEGFFDLEKMDKDLLGHLRREDYDFVVVLYNDYCGRGYEEVGKIARAISKDVLVIKPGGEIEKI